MGTSRAVRARGITQSFGDVVALDGDGVDVEAESGQVLRFGRPERRGTEPLGSGSPAQVVSQFDVTADGRCVAEADEPKGVNDYFLVRASTG